MSCMLNTLHFFGIHCCALFCKNEFPEVPYNSIGSMAWGGYREVLTSTDG